MVYEYVTYKEREFEVRGTYLTLWNLGIGNITEIKGLEKYTNLQSLYLRYNQITEIKGLEALTNLDTLALDGNKITEIKGLETLINLKTLHLRGNQITKLKGLENLSNLEALYLDNNQITEIRGLKALINLQTLNLFGNQITEIKGLKKLNKLKWLSLRRNKITEIKGLRELTNLNTLLLDENQIAEIKGLENLTNLIILHLSCNKIPSEIIEALGGLEAKAQKFVEYCCQQKEKREREHRKLIENVKKIVRVSDRIKMDMMRNALKMNKKSFDEKIFDWADEYGFRISGDEIIINQETIDDFISALEQQFEKWGDMEKGKIDKVEEK